MDFRDVRKFQNEKKTKLTDSTIKEYGLLEIIHFCSALNFRNSYLTDDANLFSQTSNIEVADVFTVYHLRFNNLRYFFKVRSQ